MNIAHRQKIVLLGMMSRYPVAGVAWQTIHYLVGFERLGYDVYYVEAGGNLPSAVVYLHADERHRDRPADDDPSEPAARMAAGCRFIARVMDRIGLPDRWAVHDLTTNQVYGPVSDSQLDALYREAALIINLHGGTIPRPEHYASGRLVYLETDPVAVQIELYHNEQRTIDYLAPHCAFFTFGENYGRADCGLPVSERFDFKPTRQPVLVDRWRQDPGPAEPATFTTIGNWKQSYKNLQFRGETYLWSKHAEFLKFLDVPARTGGSFELALSTRDFGDDDHRLLESHGWCVRNSLELSLDLDAYRAYIRDSRGEFTVAKDQNIRLRSGWFSDRAATYLAAGRPVITQDTAFGNVLPTGEGLFEFRTLDDVADAVARVRADYRTHARRAAEIAQAYFDSDLVLGQLLAELGTGRPAATPARAALISLPGDLVLTPVSRHPLVLPPDTVARVLARPLPAPAAAAVPTERGTPASRAPGGRTSVVVVTFNGLPFTRMCLESVLAANPDDVELVVVDNASTDGTRGYLAELAGRCAAMRVIFSEENLGFAAANNVALAAATGDVLVLLNNDTIVPPGWLDRLRAHLRDSSVGLVGPVTNRCGNEAQVETRYRTVTEMVAFAAERAAAHVGGAFDIRMLAMYCLGMRRDAFEQIGTLDERFGLGLFEDDDYAMRARAADYRVICAEDAFVHHFGQASFGALSPAGEYARLFHANRLRWEEKWARPWQPYERRRTHEYRSLVACVREAVDQVVPRDATVLVVSRGDDDLLDLGGRIAWHFPRTDDGTYVGHHPADSAAAVAHLEELRGRGAGYLVVPEPSFWWFDHYAGMASHLRDHYALAIADPSCRIFCPIVAAEAAVVGHRTAEGGLD